MQSAIHNRNIASMRLNRLFDWNVLPLHLRTGNYYLINNLFTSFVAHATTILSTQSLFLYFVPLERSAFECMRQKAKNCKTLPIYSHRYQSRSISGFIFPHSKCAQLPSKGHLKAALIAATAFFYWYFCRKISSAKNQPNHCHFYIWLLSLSLFCQFVVVVVVNPCVFFFSTKKSSFEIHKYQQLSRELSTHASHAN